MEAEAVSGAAEDALLNMSAAKERIKTVFLNPEFI